MLSMRQMEIFNGSMLGDGYVNKNFSNGGVCRFEKGQSKLDHSGCDKISYLDWLKIEFDEYNSNVLSGTYAACPLFKTKDYEFSDRYVFLTKNLKLWENLEKKWYVPRLDHKRFKRRKIVPLDLKLTPLTACVWYMDDGSNYSKDANITLETQSFTETEVEFLIVRLKEDLNIHSARKRQYNQFRIYIGRKSYFDFIDMVNAEVQWDCFKYKLDTSKYVKVNHRGETHSRSKLTEEQVKQMFDMRKAGKSYKEICSLHNITDSTLSLILSGKNWAHLGLKMDIAKKPRITQDQKDRIMSLKLEGLSQNEIAERLNINQSTVSRVLRRKQDA